MSKKPKWPNVYPRTQHGGQVMYRIDVGLVAGKRQRRAFKTKPEAKTYADQARVARQNEGTAAFSISGALRVDATKANQILSPHSVTLTEASSY